jgi:hypothetical protein
VRNVGKLKIFLLIIWVSEGYQNWGRNTCMSGLIVVFLALVYTFWKSGTLEPHSLQRDRFRLSRETVAQE